MYNCHSYHLCTHRQYNPPSWKSIRILLPCSMSYVGVLPTALEVSIARLGSDGPIRCQSYCKIIACKQTFGLGKPIKCERCRGGGGGGEHWTLNVLHHWFSMTSKRHWFCFRINPLVLSVAKSSLTIFWKQRSRKNVIQNTTKNTPSNILQNHF